METVRLREISIFKSNKQDRNGIEYTEYNLATSREVGRGVCNFTMLTGDKAGVEYSNIQLNINSKEPNRPAYVFDNFEFTPMIVMGVDKRFLQDVISDALVFEQKYFAMNNIYDIEKLKLVIAKLNKKIYTNALSTAVEAVMC